MIFSSHRPATLSASADTLFWAWTLHASVTLFLVWWMQHLDRWAELVRGDPSGIGVGIVALSAIYTVWIGRRARLLAYESWPVTRRWRAEWVYRIAQLNPYTHAVERMLFALFDKDPGWLPHVVLGTLAPCFALAAWGYSPQRGFGGLTKRSGGTA